MAINKEDAADVKAGLGAKIANKAVALSNDKKKGLMAKKIQGELKGAAEKPFKNS